MPKTSRNKSVEFNEALLHAISRDVFDFIAVVRLDDRKIVFVNEMGARLFEYNDPTELINIYAPSLMKNAPGMDKLKAMDKQVNEKGFYSEDIEYVTKKGNVFWGRMQRSRFSADGTSYQLLQIEKIDRAKDAEDALLKEQQRFGALLNYASLGVIIVNQQQDILLMNPFGLKLFGYDSNEVLGKKLEILIPQRVHKRHDIHVKNYYEHPQNRPMGVGMDLFAIKKDGTEFPVEVSLGTYRTEKEAFVIAFINDITVRKKAESEIRKLNTDLEKKVKERTDELAHTISKLQQQIKETEEVELELRKSLEKEKDLNELKSRFVSLASHEFRTPLSTVLSSTYLLQKYRNTEDQPKRERHIERIASSVNMLTDILNDFLSLGKIEEGKITPKFSYFNISEHIDAVISEIKTIQKKGQQINYHHTGEDMVYLDSSLLKNIVMNLLSNAIKFSPEHSTINIQTERTGSLLVLKVKDQGVGISKEDQEHLFERFFRGANVTAIQGTGLGLHIVQKYAELMDGKVECISEVDQGTEVIVRFEIKN